MRSTDITVILLLYKTPINLLQNLKVYKDFKIIILDQSNDFKLKQRLKTILPNIIYYKVTDTNRGFGAGINFLVNKVRTKFFLCTQPDVKISKKSILELKKPFLNNDNCIVSIPTINKKKIQKKIKTVKSFIGAIFLSEKIKFNKLKGFDENFFFYWEDVDLCYRINESNYEIYLNSNSNAIHLYGKSTSNDFKTLFLKKSNYKFGEYLFQYKHKKLKIIKIIREPLFLIFKIMLNFLMLNKLKIIENLSNFYGICKFLRIFNKVDRF